MVAATVNGIGLYDRRFRAARRGYVAGPLRGGSAELRLVTGGPAGVGRRPVAASSSRPGPEVYRRRRLLVAGVLLLGIAAALIVAQSVLAGTGGGPLTTTGAAATMTPARASTWVVRPGDTLWSIASAVDPGGDVRPLVDHLQATVGNDLYPGERIPIPAGR